MPTNLTVFNCRSNNWYEAVLYCNELSKKYGLDTVYSYNNKTKHFTDGYLLENVIIHYGLNGFRLPTEAEWEYACFGNSTHAFYWGNIADLTYGNGRESAGWPNDGYNDVTAPVGSFLPNQFGIFDLHGNVAEWCNDWYARLDTATQIDPEGPDSTCCKVIKGGSWTNDANRIARFYRTGFDPYTPYHTCGIRYVLNIQ